MLNRRHIRIKVLQTLYAYFISEKDFNIPFLKKELERNIWRLYDLYLFLLLLIRELSLFIEQYDDEVKASAIYLNNVNVNEHFYKNEIITALFNNSHFNEELNSRKVVWDSEDKDTLRRLFSDFRVMDNYSEFVRKEEANKSDQFEIYVFFLKHYSSNSPIFSQFIEDKFMNWHDDDKPAIQMAIKTLTTIITEPENVDFLVPLCLDTEASISFAEELFDKVIKNDEEFSTYINARIDKWEPSRIPVIDNIVLKIGLAELLYFQTIPVKVTINECIELVKNYSLPSSKKFINAVLDNLLIDLEKEGKIQKKGLGLVDK